MRHYLSILLSTLLVFDANFAMASKIQKQGIKTSAECIAAGATDATCLLTDNQIYLASLGAPQRLDQALAAGAIGGGAKNYVKNPSAGVDVSNVTASGGSLTRNTTTPLVSPADFLIDASASGQTYTWDTNTLDNTLKGGNCQATFYYNGNASLYKAYVLINSIKVTSDYQLTDASVSGSTVKSPTMFFPCGDLTNPPKGVIESTSASAAAIHVAVMTVAEASAVTVNAMSDWVAYTPIFTGFGTVTVQNFIWRRVGGNLEIQGKFTAGTPTATEKRISFPSAASISLSTLPTVSHAGLYTRGGSTVAGKGGPMLREPSVSYFTFSVPNVISGTSQDPDAKDASSSTFGAGDTVTVTAFVPIQGWTASVAAVPVDQTNYDWTAYTPTFVGFGTPTGVSCFHKKDGHNLLVQCKLTSGVSTGVTATVSLPNSLTIDASLISSITGCGQVFHGENAGATDVTLCENGASSFSFGRPTGGAGVYTKLLGSSAWTSSIAWNFTATVPITGWVENGKSPQLSGISAELYLDGAANGMGSTATKIRRFATVEKNTLGNLATYADSATNGMSVTINYPGKYAVMYADGSQTQQTRLGISVNATSLTTNIESTTYANGFRVQVNGQTGPREASVTYISNFSAGDVIRAHSDGTPTTNALCVFQMVYLGQ